MKKQIFTFLLGIFILTLSAQPSTGFEIQTGAIMMTLPYENKICVWTKNTNNTFEFIQISNAGEVLSKIPFTFSGEDAHILSVKKAENDQMLIVGKIKPKGAQYFKAWIGLIDINGKWIWENVLGGENDEFTDATFCFDGSILVCGNARSQSNGGKDGWIGYFNANGTLQWIKNYGWERDETLTTIIERNDGSILAGGTTASKGAGLEDMWLVSVEKDATTRWFRVYGKAMSNESIKKIAEIEGAQIIVTGITDERKASNGKDARTMLLEKDGSIRWSKNLGGGLNDYFESVFYDKKTETFMLFGLVTPSPNDTYTWGMRLTKNGETMVEYKDWGKVYIQNVDVADNQYCLSVLPTAQSVAHVSVPENGDWLVNTVLSTKPHPPKVVSVEDATPSTAITTVVADTEEITPAPPEPEVVAPALPMIADTPSQETPTPETPTETQVETSVTAEMEESISPATTDTLGQMSRLKEQNKDLLEPKMRLGNPIHLLTMGASTFQNAQFNIFNASTDINQVAEFFLSLSAADAPAIQPTILTDKQCVMAAVRKSIMDLSATVTEKSLTIVYIASTEVYDSTGKMLFALYDYSPDNPAKTTLTFEALANYLNFLPGNKIVLIDNRLSPSAPITNTTPDIESGLSAAFEVGENMLVIQSCKNGQQVIEEAAGVSSAVVQALKQTVNLTSDTNADGSLDSDEWAAALIAYVQSITQTQTPFVVLKPSAPFIIFKK